LAVNCPPRRRVAGVTTVPGVIPRRSAPCRRSTGMRAISSVLELASTEASGRSMGGEIPTTRISSSTDPSCRTKSIWVAPWPASGTSKLLDRRMVLGDLDGVFAGFERGHGGRRRPARTRQCGGNPSLIDDGDGRTGTPPPVTSHNASGDACGALTRQWSRGRRRPPREIPAPCRDHQFYPTPSTVELWHRAKEICEKPDGSEGRETPWELLIHEREQRSTWTRRSASAVKTSRVIEWRCCSDRELPRAAPTGAPPRVERLEGLLRRTTAIPSLPPGAGLGPWRRSR